MLQLLDINHRICHSRDLFVIPAIAGIQEVFLYVIPHLMRNPEVYSKRKHEFSIETFRNDTHLHRLEGMYLYFASRESTFYYTYKKLVWILNKRFWGWQKSTKWQKRLIRWYFANAQNESYLGFPRHISVISTPLSLSFRAIAGIQEVFLFEYKRKKNRFLLWSEKTKKEVNTGSLNNWFQELQKMKITKKKKENTGSPIKLGMTVGVLSRMTNPHCRTWRSVSISDKGSLHLYQEMAIKIFFKNN